MSPPQRQPVSPTQRNRALLLTRKITIGSAIGATALTIVGIGIVQGHFAGRTVSTSSNTIGQNVDNNSFGSPTLQPPIQLPGNGDGGGLPPITSGSS